MTNEKLLVRDLGLQPYVPIWQAMREFTQTRQSDTADELWLLQHEAVYTLGQAADPKHLLAAGNIPVVQADRGGQVTYHGPGQLVAYLLLDLRRHKLGVRQLVTLIEESLINLLRHYSIDATAQRDAPGVYVAGKKIAALGLRIKKGCSYHGLSLNVEMDLEPFSRINPCGFQDLAVTSMQTLLPDQQVKMATVKSQLCDEIMRQLHC
ncbi:MAG: lipoyl(octanoyl) transferase LipB [Pseudomonadales bacterium]